MRQRAIHMPKEVILDTNDYTSRYGRIILEPLERGFGVTLGNSLRRTLLSSIHGAAVTWIKIDGLYHEFSAIQGVVEDATEIIMNIRELDIKFHSDEGRLMVLDVKGPAVVTAADIETGSYIEILNPEHHIATLNDDANLRIEMFVDIGRGYVPAEQHSSEGLPIGVIPIDAVFSPVRKVNYEVTNTRVGHRTDYERLTLEIWTDGSIRPDDAAAFASKIIKDHLLLFINFEEDQTIYDEEEEIDEETERLRSLLLQSVEELELSVRASNCLRVANIRTLGGLVRKSEAEMLKYRNFGRKSLCELVVLLEEKGLAFGIDVDAIIGDNNKTATNDTNDTNNNKITDDENNKSEDISNN